MKEKLQVHLLSYFHSSFLLLLLFALSVWLPPLSCHLLVRKITTEILTLESSQLWLKGTNQPQQLSCAAVWAEGWGWREGEILQSWVGESLEPGDQFHMEGKWKQGTIVTPWFSVWETRKSSKGETGVGAKKFQNLIVDGNLTKFI